MLNSIKKYKGITAKCWCGKKAYWVAKYTCLTGRKRDYWYCHEHVKGLVKAGSVHE